MPTMRALFRNGCILPRAAAVPDNVGFALAEGVEYLDAAAWDALTAGRGVFMDRRYLRVLEHAGPSNLRPRYALIYRDRRPVAAIAAQSVDVQGAGLMPREAKGARRALRGAAGIWEERLMVCGNLLSCGAHGVGFAAGEDPQALWPLVHEALRRIRRAERAQGAHDFVLVKDLPAQASAASAGDAALQALSYERIETEPQMSLALEPGWRTHEDYLKALTTKYRGATRKVLKEISQAGLSVTTGPVEERDADALHALYLQVAENADIRLVTLPPSHFLELSAALGADLRCTVIRREGTPVAFMTTLRDGSDAAAYFVGFDRKVATAAPLYLRLLHAAIEEALEMRAGCLNFGRSALEPKARLGARPVPTAIYLKHRVPVMNWLLKAMVCGVEPEPAPDRNPFKELTAAAE